MNYLNAFVLVSRMNRNKVLESRFLNFSRGLSITAVVSFVLFLIINAFNTGSDVLFMVSYLLLMIALVGALQAVCLYFIGKHYGRKGE